MELNNDLDHMDLTKIYTTFQPKEAKYTFFSKAHGTFAKIDHMIGHKKSLKSSRKLRLYQAFSQTTGT